LAFSGGGFRGWQLPVVAALYLALAGHGLAPSAHAPAPVIPHGGWAYPRGASIAHQPLPHQAGPAAPRADAPIFRLNSAQQPPATPGGARYYSIHRQAGRQPDTPSLPAPVYLDALPVQLDNLPAGDDLAAPPPPPEVLRDAHGRLRPVPSSDDY